MFNFRNEYGIKSFAFERYQVSGKLFSFNTIYSNPGFYVFVKVI